MYPYHKLSKFYQFLYGHAVITLQQGQTVIYHGPLNGIPDNFDDLTVLDFKGTNTGFIFYVKRQTYKIKGG